MNSQFDKLIDWLASRPERERVLLLVLTLIVIYCLWFMLLDVGLQNKRAQLSTDIATTQQKIVRLTVGKEKLIAEASKPPDPNLLEENQALHAQFDQLNQQQNAFVQQIISPEQMVSTIYSILNETHELSLKRLENVPVTPLSENFQKYAKQKLYVHPIIFEFSGSYLATLECLQHLEKLPWHFFWDDLTYTVEKYPVGKTTIKIHTLSNKESFINV